LIAPSRVEWNTSWIIKICENNTASLLKTKKRWKREIK
jgi:hypothetical protein